MLGKIATDDEERHAVWFVLVHTRPFDATSYTEAYMAAITAVVAPLGHSA